jgi:hypothetical protein
MGSARLRLTAEDLARLGLPRDARVVAVDMDGDRARGEPVLTVEHPALSSTAGPAQLMLTLRADVFSLYQPGRRE